VKNKTKLQAPTVGNSTWQSAHGGVWIIKLESPRGYKETLALTKQGGVLLVGHWDWVIDQLGQKSIPWEELTPKKQRSLY